MSRTVEDILSGSPFADTAAVHNNDLITHICNDAKVMSYHDDGHTQFFLKTLHQLQDLRLNGYVKRCCRLICDQDIRLACQSHGDHNTLAHTAGQLIWILFYTLLRLVDANQSQHLDSAVHCHLAFTVCMKLNRFF